MLYRFKVSEIFERNEMYSDLLIGTENLLLQTYV